MQSHPADPHPARLEHLTDDVWAYVQPDGGWMINNTGLYVGDASWILVDTTSTESRNRQMLAVIDDVVGERPIAAAINTHHHGDHTYGNWLLPSHTPIIGSSVCREYVLRSQFGALERMPQPDYGRVEIRPPSVTFAETLHLDLAGHRAEVTQMPIGHTCGDVTVTLPEAGVVFAGDLIFSSGHPFTLDGSLAGYRDALAALRAVEAEVLVPGHGPVCRGDEVNEIIALADAYAEHLLDHAARSRRRGLTPLQAANSFEHPGTEHWGESERILGNLHRAYHELAGSPPGSPLDRNAVTNQMQRIGNRMISNA